MTSPISVPESATPDQLASAFRSLLIALGAYGAGKGWFDANIVAAAIPLIMILAPMLWAQLKVRSEHVRLVTMADALPDSLATVERKP